jgi:hypothetical protein
LAEASYAGILGTAVSRVTPEVAIIGGDTGSEGEARRVIANRHWAQRQTIASLMWPASMALILWLLSRRGYEIPVATQNLIGL